MTSVIEPTVLANLWEANADRLLLICRAIGEPSEDAVQEAFIALSIQAELPNDPLAWLIRTARNQILQWRRGAGRRVKREQFVGESKDWFHCEHESIEARIDGQQVAAWLERLPEDQREVIAMHIWGGMTFRQIAEVAELPVSTAHRIYHQGLAGLRERVSAYSNQGIS